MGECLIVRRGGESYELPVLSASYPRDVTVTAAAGASASFSVSITTPGRPAEYTYQWYRNGAAVSGGTAASLTLTGLTAAATYSVYCKVTNKAGSVNSRTATLTVRSYLPTYTYTGSHQLIDEGNFNWRLRLLTSGTLTFSYVGSAGTQGAQAFLVGGILCLIGQILVDKTSLTPARILVSYVVAGVVLGALGIYEPIVQFGGAGATVPLTGFGYNLAKGVRKAVTEEGFLGIFTGGLKAAAGGISVAIVAAFVAALIFRPKDKS